MGNGFARGLIGASARPLTLQTENSGLHKGLTPMSGRLLVFSSTKPRTDEIHVDGENGTRCEPGCGPGTVAEALLERVGRQDRQRAAEAIRRSGRGSSSLG